MFRQIIHVFKMIYSRIICSNCYYLIIFFAVINHLHIANYGSLNKAKRPYTLTAHNQYIKRISVLTEGVRACEVRPRVVT